MKTVTAIEEGAAMHPCEQKDNIKEIKHDVKEIQGQLGDGKVTFATMHQTLLQVLDQTQRTNGRVSSLERFKSLILYTLLGMVLFALAQSIGLTNLILKLF